MGRGKFTNNTVQNIFQIITIKRLEIHKMMENSEKL